MFDDRLAVFLHYAGSGLGKAKVTSTDPGDMAWCKSAFETVWKFAIPHIEYTPT